jgi:hypothetical protein
MVMLTRPSDNPAWLLDRHAPVVVTDQQSPIISLKAPMRAVGASLGSLTLKMIWQRMKCVGIPAASLVIMSTEGMLE